MHLWSRTTSLPASSTRRRAAAVGLQILKNFASFTGRCEIMHTKRIIPCLDVNDGRVVKGAELCEFKRCR